MNNNDINIKLIDAYKNTKKLILQDPTNKQNIIKDYIDLVLKFNNYPNSIRNEQPPSNYDTNPNPTPTDINIYNNFNAIPNNIMNGVDNINKVNNTNDYIDITKTSKRSIQELASAYNYINI